jgi:essential nuclear protein 1
MQHQSSQSHYGDNDDDDNENDIQANESQILDAKSSQRILELSRIQQIEVAALQRENKSPSSAVPVLDRTTTNDSMDSDEEDDMRSSKNTQATDDHDDDDEEGEEDDGYCVEQDDQGFVFIKDKLQGLDTEDEALIQSMMRREDQSDTGQPPRTLADIIMEKVAEKERERRRDMDSDDENDPIKKLPAKVIEVYTEIGKLLSRYTSGKLPKAFKVIPSLSNWEEILYLTRPDQWTPPAMFAATRIFASNLNPKMAQRFYYLVLLDTVRADIQQNKKLNYHYYQALRKAMYKPAAFFKGILLPLCRDNCSLREAVIVASSLHRASIPSHHAAVAIHKIASEHLSTYNGATSIVIKALLNKKYSLPSPVIYSVARHFTSFLDYEIGMNGNEEALPVLWHQALLVFVQRYKNALVDDEQVREDLRLVMKKHFHHRITPEIRRELFGAQAFQNERKTMTKAMDLVDDVVDDNEMN